MRGDTVIVRAFRARPLERRVCEVFKGKVFVCRPDLLDLCERGEAWPVGFPAGDVFTFDAELLPRLESKVKSKGRGLGAIWKEARPYV